MFRVPQRTQNPSSCWGRNVARCSRAWHSRQIGTVVGVAQPPRRNLEPLPQSTISRVAASAIPRTAHCPTPPQHQAQLGGSRRINALLRHVPSTCQCTIAFHADDSPRIARIACFGRELTAAPAVAAPRLLALGPSPQSPHPPGLWPTAGLLPRSLPTASRRHMAIGGSANQPRLWSFRVPPPPDPDSPCLAPLSPHAVVSCADRTYLAEAETHAARWVFVPPSFLYRHGHWCLSAYRAAIVARICSATPQTRRTAPFRQLRVRPPGSACNAGRVRLYQGVAV